MGLNLRILAVLVGAGAGLGARAFCREGDKSLGGVAAVIAVIGMFIGGPLILVTRKRDGLLPMGAAGEGDGAVQGRDGCSCQPTGCVHARLKGNSVEGTSGAPDEVTTART